LVFAADPIVLAHGFEEGGELGTPLKSLGPSIRDDGGVGYLHRHGAGCEVMHPDSSRRDRAGWYILKFITCSP
jgi:hypothetical protein